MLAAINASTTLRVVKLLVSKALTIDLLWLVKICQGLRSKVHTLGDRPYDHVDLAIDMLHI